MDRKVEYDSLLGNTNDVLSSINSILKTIEDINLQCKALDNSEIWSGSVQTAFVAAANRFAKYAETNILNFKNTNEYKAVSANMFFSAENDNSKNYFNIG